VAHKDFDFRQFRHARNLTVRPCGGKCIGLMPHFPHSPILEQHLYDIKADRHLTFGQHPHIFPGRRHNPSLSGGIHGRRRPGPGFSGMRFHLYEYQYLVFPKNQIDIALISLEIGVQNL